MRAKMGCFRRFMVGVIAKTFSEDVSPQKIFKEHCCLAPWFLRRYVERRFTIDKKAKKLLHEFLKETVKLPVSGETALYHILRIPRARAVEPLEPHIDEKLNIDTVVYYGDNDWMDKKGAMRLVAKSKKNFRVVTVIKSGHQITVENPEEITKHLIKEK
jgi:pimeloyl-ACP methyl ester carboxylesterase